MKNRYLLLLLVVFCGVQSAYAQIVCNVTASGDTTVCPNQPVQLLADADPDTINFRYIWSPDSTLSDSSIFNPVATPSQTTTYTITITVVDSTELVRNGDFEMGDTMFFSQYKDSTSIWDEGTYTIAVSPALTHPSFSACPDHTSGFGNMMNINGTGQPNTIVWSQTININPFTDYEFSAWMMNILKDAPTLPLLQFSINGELIGPAIQSAQDDCLWSQFFTIWNSDTATTALIEIKNQSTFNTGNDFAIDDISFRAICKSEDSVTVTVVPVLSLDSFGIVQEDTIICDSEPLQIDVDYPLALSYIWSDGTQGMSKTVSTGGNYRLSIIDVCGRTIQDSILIREGVTPIQTLPTDTIICQDNIVVLNASQPNATGYEWRGSSVFFGQNSLSDSVYTATYEGLYEVDVTNECGVITQSINITTENCACIPFVPNVFTPNDDTKNDVLQVFSECVLEEYRFSIYDRWGSRVFASTDPNETWDGRVSGKEAISGVYVYKLEYTAEDSRGQSQSSVKQGDILLIR